MSYSLNRKCGTCKKKVQCMDSTFVMAAIQGIHQANYTDAQRQVHLGAGTITIDCCNYQDERQITECPDQAPKTCSECAAQSPGCNSEPVK